MGLSLSAADLARLAVAGRTLASPLAFGTVDDWRRAAMRDVCAAVGAESACFVLGSEPRAALARHLDPEAEDMLDAVLGPASRRAGPSGNASLDGLVGYTRRARPPAWDLHAADRALGASGDLWRGEWYHEALLPFGAADLSAFFVARPAVDVVLSVHGFHRAPAPGGAVPLLTLLHPALDAGLDALERLAAHRAALDALDTPAAFFDADGCETHRTPALAALLAADPDHAHVAQGIAEAARTSHASPRPLAAAVVRVQTRRAAYTVRTTMLGPPAMGGAGGFALTVASSTPAVLPADALRERFGLTAREADVVRLVARGWTNAAVGEALSVSRHTVRHHLEAAVSKLGLSGQGRAAVAARLVEAAPKGEP